MPADARGCAAYSASLLTVFTITASVELWRSLVPRSPSISFFIGTPAFSSAAIVFSMSSSAATPCELISDVKWFTL